MDGIQQTFKFPEFMELTNISTIYKNKGSRYDLENDRGIFILSVLRKLLDKLIYPNHTFKSSLLHSICMGLRGLRAVLLSFPVSGYSEIVKEL